MGRITSVRVTVGELRNSQTYEVTLEGDVWENENPRDIAADLRRQAREVVEGFFRDSYPVQSYDVCDECGGGWGGYHNRIAGGAACPRAPRSARTEKPVGLSTAPVICTECGGLNGHQSFPGGALCSRAEIPR